MLIVAILPGSHLYSSSKILYITGHYSKYINNDKYNKIRCKARKPERGLIFLILSITVKPNGNSRYPRPCSQSTALCGCAVSPPLYLRTGASHGPASTEAAAARIEATGHKTMFDNGQRSLKSPISENALSVSTTDYRLQV